jgi:hypothetical protein
MKYSQDQRKEVFHHGRIPLQPLSSRVARLQLAQALTPLSLFDPARASQSSMLWRFRSLEDCSTSSRGGTSKSDISKASSGLRGQ